jgi:hypothetical protein
MQSQPKVETSIESLGPSMGERRMDPMATAFCLLPVFGCAMMLHNRDKWAKSELYVHRADFGEAARLKQAIRLPLNTYSTVALWVAGVHVLNDSAFRMLEGRANDCTDAFPEWHVAIGVALLWVGVSALLFHASLAERWRVRSAGAAMGAAVFPATFSVFRALRLLQPALVRTAPRAAVFGVAVFGFLICNVLARAHHRSLALLVPTLALHAAIEWTVRARCPRRRRPSLLPSPSCLLLSPSRTAAAVSVSPQIAYLSPHFSPVLTTTACDSQVLRPSKLPEHALAWIVYAVLMLVGLGLRTADRVRHRLPEGSLAKRLAWIGRPACNVLVAGAVLALLRAGRTDEYKEAYCF